jgi:hypothetical protein
VLSDSSQPEASSFPPVLRDVVETDPPIDPAGTPPACSGVGTPDDVARPVVATPKLGLRNLVMILLASFTLLGQGEKCRVDPRFSSPSATLLTFWEALRAGDAEDVWECFVEGQNDLPLPGMLWFLPPTERLALADFRALPVTSGRVLVRYEVRFVPRGFDEERVFVTGDELVRIRGQWRIARPIGQVSAPIWDSPPQTVDI